MLKLHAKKLRFFCSVFLRLGVLVCPFKPLIPLIPFTPLTPLGPLRDPFVLDLDLVFVAPAIVKASSGELDQ